jgi:hypothetical protein
LTLKRVNFQGKQYDIRVERDGQGKATLVRKAL